MGEANTSWVDGLQELLRRADPHAIVSWLASDSRLEKLWREGDTEAKLMYTPRGLYKARYLLDQTIPSYALWLMRQEKWIPIPGGRRVAPADCTLAPNLPDKVKTMLPRPSLRESDEPFRRLGVDWAAIRRGLELVGVSVSIHELPWDVFYDLLFGLPERDPRGEQARTMYRLLVSRVDDDGVQESSIRKQFLREGKLRAKRDGAADYFRVFEGVYYADDVAIPEMVASRMPVLDLERGRGSRKVERLFGAKPLSTVDVVIEVDPKSVDLHPRDEDLRTEVERFKVYAYAMRLHADDDAIGLTRLRNLDVVLCRGTSATAIIRDNERDMEHQIEISLGDGETLLEAKGTRAAEGDTAYIGASGTLHSSQLM